ADLSVEFFRPPSAPPIGSALSMTTLFPYTTLFRSSGVTARFAVPAGYTITNGGPGVGTYDRASGDWTIGTMSPNGSAELDLGAKVNATGPYDLVATITGSGAPDPDLTNNQATAPVTPNTNADVRISF